MNSNQKSPLGLSSNLSLRSLQEILEYFKNDRATLYSLLFVSRLWCKIVVPLLWRQPFDMASLENYDLIIQTYIYCLSEKEKSRFIFAGVKLPHHPTPFFDYPTYLRSFDSDKFRQALNSWSNMNVVDTRFDPLNILCKPIKMLFGPMVKDRYSAMPRNILHKAVNKCIEPIVQDYYSTRPNFDVAKEMTSLLFSGCDRLRSLKICYDEDSSLLMGMIDALCMKKVNALCKLQSFELCIRTTMKKDIENVYEILEKFFSTMTRYATNIQHIKIDVPHILEFPQRVHIALYAMISSQKNLNSYMSNYFWDSVFSIHSTLKNRSIKRLRLWGLTYFDDSLVQGLLKWVNLETLELIGCPISSIPCEQLFNQLNIKNLQLGNGYGNSLKCPTHFDDSLVQGLLKRTISSIPCEHLSNQLNIKNLQLLDYGYSNSFLKQLSLWSSTYFNDSLVQGLLKILELVSCPIFSNHLNIKNLQLGNGYENYPYITTTLLQICNKNLQKLIIEGITLEILEEISQHCPNITHLSLCAYQDISKSLPILISSLHHLKVLTLGHHEKFLFIDSTIDQFIQSIPTSLRSLCLNFNISFNFLKILLEKSQFKLYELELHQSETYSDNFIKLLIDYTKNQTQIKLYIPSPEHFPAPSETASLKVLKNASKYFNIYYKKNNRNFYNLW